MRTLLVAFKALLVCAMAGCSGMPDPANPFITLAEMTGGGASQNQQGGGGQHSQPPAAFRATMTVDFNNLLTIADLDTSFLAWVDPGSVSTADQQGDLLNSNYVQLTQELALGNAFTLGVGTYVYNGPGAAHATAIHLGPSEAASQGSTGTVSHTGIQLVTPDAILVFSQPPVSCDSVAFTFSQQGEPLPPIPAGAAGPWSGATNYGGLKTLAQIDAYQCNPFKPGVFLHRSGGQMQPNEFLEGQNVVFAFFLVPENGYCANVTFENQTTTP